MNIISDFLVGFILLHPCHKTVAMYVTRLSDIYVCKIIISIWVACWATSCY